MTTIEPPITADLARAARALAQVSLADLADAAELETEDLRRVERGNHSLTDEEELRLRRALEDFGVELLPADDDAGHGYGVRQKFTHRTAVRVENWENEGGPAGEDDI
ncbi:hypothetical protein ACT3SP_16350 [Brachybacterium sp. AOP43-C2-M15]|uniref:hypothetical protein n=1 Tax=Brachybacterium sp. AOP43-C2-M15 TaxID=3457661 RepID=UPI004034616B